MKAARLIVLGVAVAAGGLAALLAGRSGEKAPPPPVAQLETVDVLVAKSDIGQGTVVKPEELQWQMWPAASANSNFIRKSDRPDAIEQVAGSIVRGGTFFAGEPIQESRLVKANGAAGYLSAILPSGMRAVATEISAETSAGGFVIPGDYVDVILARRDREAQRRTGIESYISETIISNVRVLAVDQTVEDKNGQKVVIGKTVTLELTPLQAEAIAAGKQAGTLSLALRSVVDTGKGATDGEEDPATRRTSVNVVRFGVSTPNASR